MNRRQTIHLGMALIHLNQDRQDLRNNLTQILGRLEKLEVDRRSIMTHEWQSIHDESSRLGLEEVNYFVQGILFLKNQPKYLEFIDIKQLELKLKSLLTELDETIHNLDKYNFFEDKKNKGGLNRLEGRNVLIVEDMAYNRILLKKILQRHNCITVEAVNGKDAVDQWRRNPKFDLVIMDMNMPVMDGFTATRSMRQYEAENAMKRTPIIALT
ncbi:MAG: response regulator, partial [bacterium]